jgi:hypothetical protein
MTYKDTKINGAIITNTTADKFVKIEDADPIATEILRDIIKQGKPYDQVLNDPDFKPGNYLVNITDWLRVDSFPMAVLHFGRIARRSQNEVRLQSKLSISAHYKAPSKKTDYPAVIAWGEKEDTRIIDNNTQSSLLPSCVSVMPRDDYRTLVQMLERTDPSKILGYPYARQRRR